MRDRNAKTNTEKWNEMRANSFLEVPSGGNDSTIVSVWWNFSLQMWSSTLFLAFFVGTFIIIEVIEIDQRTNRYGPGGKFPDPLFTQTPIFILRLKAVIYDAVTSSIFMPSNDNWKEMTLFVTLFSIKYQYKIIISLFTYQFFLL